MSSYGAPLTPDASVSRKELTARLEQTTRRILTLSLRGVSFSAQPR